MKAEYQGNKGFLQRDSVGNTKGMQERRALTAVKGKNETVQAQLLPGSHTGQRQSDKAQQAV